MAVADVAQPRACDGRNGAGRRTVDAAFVVSRAAAYLHAFVCMSPLVEHLSLQDRGCLQADERKHVACPHRANSSAAH